VVLVAVAVSAALAGLVIGYILSKHAVEWCPACGRSLEGHCPDARPFPSAAGKREVLPSSDLSKA
jgi:hypothetical protein